MVNDKAGRIMITRTKVLFVGINYKYINPTNSHLLAALSKEFSVHFFGPGFVSQDVLDGGIERYIDSIGGVDLIFASKDVCSGYDVERIVRFIRRYVVMLNGGQLKLQTYKDISAYLKKNRERVVCFLTDLDPHAVPLSDLTNFQEHAQFFVTWGEQFLNTLGDKEWVAREQHLQKKLHGGKALGLLDGFAARESSHIISLGFFVSESEFYWGGLANRSYDVAVPGSKYARRQYFLNSLQQVPGLRLPKFFYKIFYQIGDRLALRPFTNFYLVNLYNLFFQRILSRSKSCITDGGANNYPVRKFFEIPAAGALLVCPPATGMNALGFRDKVNYVSVRDASEAIEVITSLAADSDGFESIAAAGRDLVFRRHSLWARAEQLRDAVGRIICGNFNGSFWEDGRFVCQPGTLYNQVKR